LIGSDGVTVRILSPNTSCTTGWKSLSESYGSLIMLGLIASAETGA
jgi:hypothetical protein